MTNVNTFHYRPTHLFLKEEPLLNNKTTQLHLGLTPLQKDMYDILSNVGQILIALVLATNIKQRHLSPLTSSVKLTPYYITLSLLLSFIQIAFILRNFKRQV